MMYLVLSLLCAAAFGQQSKTQIEHHEIFGEKAQLLDDDKSLTEIDSREIRQKQASTREELLRDIPGVSIVNDRPLTDTVIIRGLMNRSLEVVDGSRNQFDGGHINAASMDPYFLEKIEVKNNSEASSYGSGSIGGAILYETFDIQQILKGKHWGGRLQSQTGSVQDQSVAGLAGFESGKNRFGLGLSHRKFRNRLLSNGERMPLSALESDSILIKFEREQSRFHNSFSMSHREDKSDSPLNPLSNSILQTAQTARTQWAVKNNLRWAGDNSQGQFHVSTDQTQVKKAATKAQNYGLRPREDLREKQKVQARLSAHHQWTDKYSTYHEFETYKNRLSSSRLGGIRISSFPAGDEQETSIHSRHIYHWDRMRMSVGARAQRFSVNTTGASRTNQHIVGESTLAASLNSSWVLQAGLSQSYQNPSISRLFPVGMHFPSFRPGIPDNLFLSNTNLRPETANQYELVAIFNHQSIYFKSTYFQTHANDFISQEIDVRGGNTQFVNVSGVVIEGIESQFKYDHGPLSYSIGSHFQWMKDKKLGSATLDQSANRLNVKIFDNGLLNYKLNSFISLAYQSKQQLVSDGLQVVGGAGTVDLGTSYVIQNDWKLSANVHNFLNRKYYMAGSPYAAPGRTFLATAELTY